MPPANSVSMEEMKWKLGPRSMQLVNPADSPSGSANDSTKEEDTGATSTSRRNGS